MRVRHVACQKKPKVLFFAEYLKSLIVGCGGNHDFGEDSGDPARRFGVDRPVGGDNAAEGADRVGGKRGVPGIVKHGRAGDAARVCMLDDGNGRFGELGRKLECGIGIIDIVVGERLSLNLRGTRNTGP